MGTFTFWEVDVSGSSPSWTVFDLLCTAVGDAVFAVVPTWEGAVGVVAVEVGLRWIYFVALIGGWG